MAMILLVVFSLAALAQPPDTAQIENHGEYATLTVNTFRPLDAIATAFGISAEDPFYLYSGDTMDISQMGPGLKPGTLVPKRQKLAVNFPVDANGSPKDLGGLLRRIVDKYNAQTPFAYRLDSDGGYFFVPTRTRDAQGRSVAITPLLDRRVTIPPGTRRIMESAHLMAQDLSRQTGLQVSCCQSSVAGIPWGMEMLAFAAHDEPARSVLKRLGLTRWHARCDSSFCFIDMR